MQVSVTNPQSSTLQLVVQISAIDKDITPRDVKFRYSLNTESSNFTLTDNYGEGYPASQPGSFLVCAFESESAWDNEQGQELTRCPWDFSICGSESPQVRLRDP